MDEEEALASVVFRVKGQCSDAGVEIVREYVQERLGSSIDYFDARGREVFWDGEGMSRG